MYRDEALTRARSGRLDGDAGREQATRDAELIELGHYLAKAELPNRQGPKIALIGAQGAVVRQGSPWEPGWGDLNIVGDTVARAIDDAAANPDIRAIVLRIESPGGSYVAADRIWRAVSEARQRKPVIASFGNVAASGGYFMSMAASKILAPPASITGSIGVFGGKFVVRDLVQSVGIDIDSVEAGRHAGMWRPDRPFDAEEKRRFAEALDRIYGDFTEKLAAARRLSAEDVDRVSRGRIWTGEEAQRVGLIDKLGGYHDALIEARIAASLAPDAPITIETYPRRKRWILSAVEALRQGRWLDGIEETIRATIGLLRLLRDISEFAPIS
jgi:protease-4